VEHLDERDVLIIEDSPAVGILLKEFLVKLGLKNIRHCQTGKTGLEAFNDLVNENKTPLVFLDYNLPDMNGHSILSQILSIKPDTKVIIETAREESEEPIRDVIAQGAYQYLAKPIRLERLKDIINTLKMEETQPVTVDDLQTLEKAISNTTQISLLRLSQYLDKPEDEVISSINQLVASKKVTKINDIKEVKCFKCDSVRIAQLFHCPKCKGSNFKQDKIIEHYKCGNVSSASSYTDDKCPKCRESIKVFGVDYRVQENYYICNECDDVFGELLIDYLCLKCNNKFTLENAKIISSPGYTYLKNSS
jgi:response regulator of citrate/malate metabolism